MTTSVTSINACRSTSIATNSEPSCLISLTWMQPHTCTSTSKASRNTSAPSSPSNNQLMSPQQKPSPSELTPSLTSPVFLQPPVFLSVPQPCTVPHTKPPEG